MLEEFNGANVKGFAIWVPMMRDDSIEMARKEAARFEGLPVTHAWDDPRQFGNLFARTLGLSATAWDVYLLYGSGIRWDWNLPPLPAFWMHQLPASVGADGDMTLHPKRLADELVKLLGDEVENT